MATEPEDAVMADQNVSSLEKFFNLQSYSNQDIQTPRQTKQGAESTSIKSDYSEIIALEKSFDIQSYKNHEVEMSGQRQIQTINTTFKSQGTAVTDDLLASLVSEVDLNRVHVPTAPRGNRAGTLAERAEGAAASCIRGSYSHYVPGNQRDSYRPVYGPACEVPKRKMADAESRNRDDRGDRGYGGGGGRGYNNRKRRQRDDDEYDRGERPDQRRRYHSRRDLPGSRMTKELLTIAESAMRDPAEQASSLAKLLIDNYEDEYVRKNFTELVTALVSEQPFKIPFVAAIVLHANNQKGEVAQEVLTRVGEYIQVHVEAGNWRTVKLGLRFLACMQGIYNDDGIFTVLDELFNKAVDLQTASSEDVLGLELVKIILFTIPYLMASSATGLEEKVTELLERTGIVASAAHALEPLVDPYPTKESDPKPMACPSLLSILQQQLQNEASNGWKLSCIPRIFSPDVAMTGVNENGDGEAKAPAKHAFPTITLPSTVNPGSRALFPEIYFSLFADQDVESVPPTSDIASSIIREAIVDTINVLDYNRNMAAKYLTEIDCFWAPGTFVKRATMFDKLRDVEEGRSTWKPEDMVIDAVFSQIFQLPAPEHRLVYYHSVITETCRIAPAAIAPTLGRAIRFLFRNIDVMDMELAYRYMDWFAHHLSNYEFRWKWTEWVDEVERSELQPKKAFILGALDKEIRLAFAKRIRDTLPPEIKPLIPEAKDKDTPDFKYDNDQTPYAQQGREVQKLLRKKASEDEIEGVLNEIQRLAAEHGVTDDLIPSTDAYMTAICAIGSKSLSHALSYVDRCKDRLLAVGARSEAARRQIITSVVEYWKDQPGVAVNLVSMLLNYSIITPMSVIEWALHDHLDRGRALARPYIYELVNSTMSKVTNRARGIVQARNDPSLPADQRAILDQTLASERQSMRELFAAIDDAVAGVASAANDEMIERFDGESPEQSLVQTWGERWARVWRRKAAVEEASVGEAAVQAAFEAAQAAAAAAAANADADGEAKAETAEAMDQVE